MFRDLKEYQEIARIYAEKVSKPEDLEENQANRMKMKELRTSNKPKTRAEVGLPPKKKPSPFERKFGAERNEKRLIQSGLKKPLPTTAEIRAKDAASGGKGMSNIPKAEGSAVIDGKKLNPNFGKKVDIKKEFPDRKMNPIEKKNRERLGDARVDALKAKNKDFQAMKKGGMSKDDFIKKYPKSITAKKAPMEEFTPYDIVLEYLLSSKQASTIEEANYIMTEMDAETIQSIVSD